MVAYGVCFTADTAGPFMTTSSKSNSSVNSSNVSVVSTVGTSKHNIAIMRVVLFQTIFRAGSRAFKRGDDVDDLCCRFEIFSDDKTKMMVFGALSSVFEPFADDHVQHPSKLTDGLLDLVGEFGQRELSVGLHDRSLHGFIRVSGASL